MSRKLGFYLILAVFLFTVSTAVSASSNQTESDSLTKKQQEEIKAIVQQEFLIQKEQLKQEILEEIKKNQEKPQESTNPRELDPQLKLLN